MLIFEIIVYFSHSVARLAEDKGLNASAEITHFSTTLQAGKSWVLFDKNAKRWIFYKSIMKIPKMP